MDGIRTVEDLKKYAHSLRDLPKVYNGGLLPTDEVAALGFNIMLTGRTHLVVFKAVKEAFEMLKTEGTVPEEFKATERGSGIIDMVTDMLGLPEIYKIEERYKT
jgi:hypothetical protein